MPIILFPLQLSLRNLMSKVIRSEPHFIRCIRPNIQNIPNLIDSNIILQQLKNTGVLETIHIRQQVNKNVKKVVNLFVCISTGNIAKTSSAKECIFNDIALHLKCRSNKNSLLQGVGMGQSCKLTSKYQHVKPLCIVRRFGC